MDQEKSLKKIYVTSSVYFYTIQQSQKHHRFILFSNVVSQNLIEQSMDNVFQANLFVFVCLFSL